MTTKSQPHLSRTAGKQTYRVDSQRSERKDEDQSADELALVAQSICPQGREDFGAVSSASPRSWTRTDILTCPWNVDQLPEDQEDPPDSLAAV